MEAPDFPRCQHVIVEAGSVFSASGTVVGKAAVLKCGTVASVRFRGAWRCYTHFLGFVRKAKIGEECLEREINELSDLRCVGGPLAQGCDEPVVGATQHRESGLTVLVCAKHKEEHKPPEPLGEVDPDREDDICSHCGRG